VHDFLTVGAPAPLQIAAAHALNVGDDYCRQLAADYTARRAKLVPALLSAGFACTPPEGAYYVITDVTPFLDRCHGEEFARWLVREVGVATVPGSSFYHDGSLGAHQTRFCYSKVDPTLDAAAAKLRAFAAR